MSDNKYPRYESYKHSGVEWLGEIPSSWNPTRLRYVVEVNPSVNVEGTLFDTPVSFLPMEAIGDQGQLDLTRMRPLEEVVKSYSYFRDGDITVAKVTPCFENGKGALMAGLTPGFGFGTTEVTTLRPKENINAKFIYYLTVSQPFRRLGAGEMFGAGGLKRVPDEFFKNLMWPLPRPDEQQAIAKFLDRETTKVDNLIAKQERMIELLTEKRQAVITHAVTKGLNPDVEMKDSGVEWLGRVPSHWTTRQLKDFLLRNDGGVWGDDPEGENDVIVLRSTEQAADGSWNIADPAKRKLSKSDLKKALLVEGDLLLTKSSGSDLHIGKTSLVTAEIAKLNACYSNFMQRLRVSSLVTPKFIHYVLNSQIAREQFVFHSQSTTGLSNLNAGMINSLMVTAPPLAEQKTITEFLDRETAKVDALIEKSRKAIELQKEHRASLISAAVTGKIDVRGLA